MNEPSCTKSTAELSTSLMALTQRWSHLVWEMGVAGMGLLTTIIAAPVVVGLEQPQWPAVWPVLPGSTSLGGS